MLALIGVALAAAWVFGKSPSDLWAAVVAKWNEMRANWK